MRGGTGGEGAGAELLNRERAVMMKMPFPGMDPHLGYRLF